MFVLNFEHVLFQKPLRTFWEHALEFLGMQQCVDEIAAEQDGDAKADDGFIHCAFLSKTTASARIGARDNKENDAEAEIDEVGHDPLLFQFCP